jgi:predicted ATPase/DNA-binding SARP family transcriptional activator
VALLGYLVAEQRLIAREFLAALFWPDEATSKGRSNLSRELHNLAQILPDCWELDPQAVAFVPSPEVVVDTYTLLQLEAEERWQEAAELLDGEFLEGLHLDDNLEFESWLLGERERWRVHTETVLTRVIEGHTRRGRYADALRHTQRLLQLAPWNENAHRQAMRLLAWTGQRGAALRQFETCKQALWEELGVQPAGETAVLCQQIQAGELDLPPQVPTFLTEEGARHRVDRPPFVAREQELARLDTFLNAALAGQVRVILITGGPGRGKTALLDAFARRAMEAHPDLLIASGNCTAYSDVGDPYLPFRDVMAMLTGDVEAKWDAGAITRDHVQRLWAALPLAVQALLDHGPDLLDVLVPGAALLSRAVIAEPAGAPWLQRLRAHVSRQATGANDIEQSYLFQQATRVLCTVAREKPLLLMLDDIQWADAASISLLFHLGRRLAGAAGRILIACAYRPEEAVVGRNGERHVLARVLSEFRRTFGDVWLDLGQADRREGRRFIDALLDAEPNRLAEGFRSALFHRTQGHPLYTIELLRDMQERGSLLKDEDGCWIEGPALDWEALPARVEAVVAERIDRLDPELREILTVASVEGEVFTAQVVAEVQEMAERQLLHRLSQDLERRHRLVREQEEVETGQRRLSRYRFGHAVFQDYVYRRLSLGERRLLHGDVATALERLYDGQLDEMAVQLAHHFENAGDYIRTFRYSTLAAERASRLYAKDEAIAHYTRAIELAHRVSPDAVSLGKLHRGRGLAREALGEFDRARADHQTILRIARAADERRLEWRALLDLGKLWASRDYNRARGYFERALNLARGMDNPAALADSLNWMGNWHANAEDSASAVEYHQQALEIVEELGDRRDLANTLDLLGLAHLLRGDLTASVRTYNRAIALCRELDDRPRLVTGLIARAVSVSLQVMLASVPASAPPDALCDLEEAIRIAQETDSASDEAWAHWALGLLNTVQGRLGHAMQALQEGLRIAVAVGHREYEWTNRWALGVLYVELLAPEPARQQLEAALTLARESRSQLHIHYTTGALAWSHFLQGDIMGAQTCLETVLSADTPMDTMGHRYCWARRAELALAHGDPRIALDIVERLIATAPGMSPGRVITFLWKLKGEALAAMGDMEAGCSLLQAAIENARSTGERFLSWHLHASLGRLYRAMDRQPEAQVEFSHARELIEDFAGTVPEGELRDSFLQRAHARLSGSA